MCTPIPQAQEEHGDITEFILITHEHSYMSRVFMSFFPFMCAFVKKGAAITERQRQKYSKRKDDQYMLSSYFKANKHHMLPSAVQRAPQKITYQSGGKKSKSGGLLFFTFITISLLWYITQARSTTAIYHLNFCVVLVLYLPLFHVSLCKSLSSQEGVQLLRQAGIGSEQSRHGSGTRAQRAFLWPSRSPLVFLIFRVLKLKGWSTNGSKGYVSTHKMRIKMDSPVTCNQETGKNIT